ncbi:hypothetical protein [Rhodococcus sp. H29-C3]|uniref:hypothetical protein n=1 Tax=Rhodococcus sp. H29-C3 TaxID=3046307 RepID=UPI0024B9C989|nr:hypothetical protein [Rhodococcus sp. H29-C3]MDJ0359709.1 hypothetical protein [Rhodococcus sp. H29-C3]
MSVLPDTLSAAEVIARLHPDGGENTVLARVEHGPFEAEVTRYQGKDGTEAWQDAPRIQLDCSDQDGGAAFNDLTVLPEHVSDFLKTVVEIVADYRALTQTSNENTPDARQGASGAKHPNPALTKETN